MRALLVFPLAALALAGPVGAAGFGSVDPAADAPPGLECDRLAAFGLDPRASAPHVATEALDGRAVVRACSAALEVDPGSARHLFQLGRGLQRLGMTEQALRMFDAAARAGHGAAAFMLGLAHAQGAVEDADDGEALRLYAAAYDRGVVAAMEGAARIYEDPASPHHDPAAAARARALLDAELR